MCENLPFIFSYLCDKQLSRSCCNVALRKKADRSQFSNSGACEKRGIAAINPGRKDFHFETSDLTGASLDKAGSIHPLKRVGIIEWGWGRALLKKFSK
jgi:hypothetical protein